MSLTACLPHQPVPSKPPELLVYKDQYILHADGEFNPWYPGARNTPVLPSGSYTIDEAGNYKLLATRAVSARANDIVPYRPEEDECLDKEYCSPNYVVSIDNDPLLPSLWGLEYMELEPVWEQVDSSPSIQVAVLDTGVMCDHEDIGECYEQRDLIEGQDTQSDGNGHGSHVAGTICSTSGNKIGIRGVSGGCKISAYKFLGRSGSGSVFNAIKGVRLAVQRDVDIINASFGGGGFVKAFQQAINEARAKGILFIAAAGNNGTSNDTTPHFPSNYDNVISVASLDRDGELSSFSNYGDSVDVSAPGRGIVSTWKDGKYKSLSGTSMATPHVAGVAALLLEKYKHLPKLQRADLVERILLDSIDDRKILNAKKAFGIEDICDQRRCKRCTRKCYRRTNCGNAIRCATRCYKKTNCVGC